jgi:hypothetical protein
VGWSDYSPAGSAFFFAVGGAMQRHDDAADTWVALSTPPSPGIDHYAGGAWYGGHIYAINNGFVSDFTVSTNSWVTTGSGIAPTYQSMSTHDDAGNIYALTSDSTYRIVQFVVSTSAVNYFAGPAIVPYEPRAAWDSLSHKLYFAPRFDNGALYSFDPTTKTVALLGSNPDGGMNDVFCSDRSGHLYAAGGATGCSGTNSMWQYDVATNSWKRIPDLPFDHGCTGACTVTDDGWLYMTDGATPSHSARITLL